MFQIFCLFSSSVQPVLHLCKSETCWTRSVLDFLKTGVIKVYKFQQLLPNCQCLKVINFLVEVKLIDYMSLKECD